ncbi:RNA polymerase sigma-70 factor [Ravibacter arvi]|uniref:RNA polymerase sigma-70 factor n=1 Tax=Ravibacter arvi TaxID=2051041 RepID=A0ABP8LV68_9BACT
MQDTVVPDAELLKHLAMGEEYALRAIYKRYWSRLYDYVVQRVTLQGIAEEIVQDIFIDLWRRRNALEIERFEAYLFRAARNRVIDVIRANQVRKHHEEASDGIRSLESQGLDGEEALAYEELQSAIQTGLTLLPEKTREIFRLNRLDQMSAKEISVLTDIPVRTVEYHITFALRTMKEHLRRFLICSAALTAAGFGAESLLLAIAGLIPK